MADPGCWLLHYTVTTFRRLAREEPLLVQHWCSFHSSSTGSLLAGPFSQLLHVLNQVNWHVDPPYVVDHDNCRHHLLSLPCSALTDLLTDAWFQYIARRAVHRKTMSDLAGLDTKLAQRLHKSLDPLQRSLYYGLFRLGRFVRRLLRRSLTAPRKEFAHSVRLKTASFIGYLVLDMPICGRTFLDGNLWRSFYECGLVWALAAFSVEL